MASHLGGVAGADPGFITVHMTVVYKDVHYGLIPYGVRLYNKVTDTLWSPYLCTQFAMIDEREC